MERPRIKRTTEFVDAPDGDVYLLRPSVQADLRIEQPSQRDRELLASLDGEHTLEQLHDEFGQEVVAETIAHLHELGVLEDAAFEDRVPPRELARFDRQLRYFSDAAIGGGTPADHQRRLRDAKVAVLGVGGLGGSTALWLASIGIGEMWLIDGDEVEESNLNRQILYTEADLGQPKAERAMSRLRSFNSAMTITATIRRLESELEIADFIHGADVVVASADWPAHEIERWTNSACFEAGIPYITMSHFPPIARVGPLFVPERTGCFECQLIGYRRQYPLLEVALEQRRAQPSPAGNLGPACGLIGGQAGMEVMHLVTGLCEPSTLGVAHTYDLLTMRVEREAVTPEPDCPVCGHLPRDQRTPAM